MYKRQKVDLAIDQINSNLGSEIDTVEYAAYSEQIEALYSGKVDAMIYNKSLDELIEENNPGFLEKVRIIDNFDVETEVFMEDVYKRQVRQVPVHIVAGEVSNMKITTAADYKIAQIMAENGELNTENL